ncbi:hypothetical protein PG996_011966 [Apiospora saccharicola]|uniref:Uncharacterized protein n=1 Tax=Apiospora saccharicola TaxID=335842 RepID=A0ABR1U183_9PEZI
MQFTTLFTLALAAITASAATHSAGPHWVSNATSVASPSPSPSVLHFVGIANHTATAVASSTSTSSPAAQTDDLMIHSRNFHSKRQDMTKIMCNAICLTAGKQDVKECRLHCGMDE